MRIDLPLDPGVAATLRAGEHVELNGPVFTARDATHMRLIQDLEESGTLPFELEGQLLFYAGPTPARSGRPHGAIGPTTAKRMDKATLSLLDAGIAATLGKGRRSADIASACARHKTVYFGAVGGAAALLAKHIISAEPVAYDELGTEALVRLELKDFPAFVALDSQGNDLYEQAPRAWREVIAQGEQKGEQIENAPLTRGRFITFEGGEGAGKSTQIQALARQLEMRGIKVLVVREPGGSVVGEAIRNVLLDPANKLMASHTELFLYEAARAQVVEEIIKPALNQGTTVLCDRYYDSTTAYQGYGRGLDIKLVKQLNEAAVNSVVPDRTLVLDVDPTLGLSRATQDGQDADRLEQEALAFHQRVRGGFLALAQSEPERVRVIEPNLGITHVFHEVLLAVADLFPELDFSHPQEVE